MAETIHFEELLTRARTLTRRSVGWWITQTVKTLSHRVNINPALQRLCTGEALVLLYHKVQRRPVGLWGEPVIGLEEFERQISYLARRFELVSLEALLAALRGARPMPSRAVAVTFDDGYRNNALLAAPVLARHHVPATLFVISGLVGTDRWMWAYELEEMFLRNPVQQIGAASQDPIIEQVCSAGLPRREAMLVCVDYLKRLEHAALGRVMEALRQAMPVEVDDENRFLSWDELRALGASGFDFGAHTVTHPLLPRVPLAQAERELIACREELEQRLGVRPAVLSYPNGTTSPAITELAERHYEAALTTRPGVCSGAEPLHELPRLCAPASVEELDFELTRHFVASPGADLAEWGTS